MELEIIVLKAMEKRPQDRYATAQELADDLRRWLLDQPIRARRPSWVQVVRKWMRRHQGVVWSAAVSSVLIVAVLGAGGGWMAHDRTARRAKAAENFDQAIQLANTSTQQEKWPEARAAARRAADLLADAGGDFERQQRLQQVEADLKMATDLEFASLQSTQVKDEHFDGASAELAYTAAFRAYNLDVLELEPDEAARRIADSAIRQQLLAALVNWIEIGADVEQKPKIGTVLRLADNNQWEREVWDSVLHHDKDRLLRLVQSAEALDRSPAHVVATGRVLASVDKRLAVDFLRRAQQRHRDDFWINHNMAAYLMEVQPPQWEEAIGFYRAAVAVRPQSPGAIYNLGRALHQHGRREEAIAEYREAIRLKKDYVEAHRALATALHQQGQLDEAIAEYREAIQLQQDHAATHGALGNALREKGLVDDAIAEYREAISLKRDFAELHNNLGALLANKGRLDEAIAEYREAIRLKKDDSEAHYNLGSALHDRGQLDEAIAEFREAIRIKEDNADAHCILGHALTDKGRLDEAIDEYRKALSLKKDSPIAHCGLGNALRKKGRLDEAIAEFRQSISLNNRFAHGHYHLGNALHDKGQLDEAIDEFHWAIRLNKDFADAHRDLGNAYHHQERFEEALAEYREAIRINKADAEAHCMVGLVLCAQGKFRQAVEALRHGHDLGSRQAGWRCPSAQWLRDAERFAKLDARLPALLNGQEQPRDAHDCLELAQLCQLGCKKRYFGAVRFYRDAFQKNPKLADDLNAQLRYSAACAAVLAGCGQDADADKLDTKERARLRQQALDWLRADLKAYRQLMDKSAGKAGPVIAQRMQHWLKDTDFTGVRGPDVLAKLPEEERAEWQKLWQEVETLQQRAANPSTAASSARP